MSEKDPVISLIESLDTQTVHLSRRRFLRYGTVAGLTALVGPLLAGCAQQASPTATAAPKATAAPTQAPAAPTQAPAAAPTKAPESKPEAKPAQPWNTSIVLFGGSQAAWADVMKERTLEKYNIKLQTKLLTDVRATYTAMIARDAEFYGAGWLTAADIRLQGQAKMVNIGSNSYETSVVYVKAGSPIKNLSDLKGKKIGVYGSAAGTSTHLLRVLSKEVYGFDIVKEAQVSYAAPPVIHEQLLRGQLDASYNSAVGVPEILLKSKFTIISDVSDEWSEKKKTALLVSSVATYDDVIQKNPDGVRNFLKGRADAIEYLKANPAIAKATIKKIFDITDEETAQLTTDFFFKKVTYKWNKDIIKAHIEIGRLASEIVGKDVVAGVPEDSFTDQFSM